MHCSQLQFCSILHCNFDLRGPEALTFLLQKMQGEHKGKYGQIWSNVEVTIVQFPVNESVLLCMWWWHHGCMHACMHAWIHAIHTAQALDYRFFSEQSFRNRISLHSFPYIIRWCLHHPKFRDPGLNFEGPVHMMARHPQHLQLCTHLRHDMIVNR